jgi:hypothetical protein
MPKDLKPIQCICGNMNVYAEVSVDSDFPYMPGKFIVETVTCHVCNTTLSSYEGVKMWNILMTQLRRNKKRQGE